MAEVDDVVFVSKKGEGMGCWGFRLHCWVGKNTEDFKSCHPHYGTPLMATVHSAVVCPGGKMLGSKGSFLGREFMIIYGSYRSYPTYFQHTLRSIDQHISPVFGALSRSSHPFFFFKTKARRRTNSWSHSLVHGYGRRPTCCCTPSWCHECWVTSLATRDWLESWFACNSGRFGIIIES